MNPLISIVIPTMNHLDDLLRPCVESILQYTTLSRIELIIVSNGSSDGTKDYFEELKLIKNLKFIPVWVDEPLGFTNATNEGIKVATGEYVLLLNNDTVLLQHNKDHWLEMLLEPFNNDSTVGITGTKGKRCEYTGYWFLIFFCVLIKSEVFHKIGMLDSIFNPGFGEDTDFCIRTTRAGYKIKEVGIFQDDVHYVSDFPIYHKAEGTLHDNKELFDEVIKRNIETLKSRYNTDKPKISIVIPTYNHCDDLLKPCIESIIKYTDLSNVEVLIVANGCADNTSGYVKTLDKNIFKLIWFENGLGYTKATNTGIIAAQGEYIILLNNDIILLPQEKNLWINYLITPFEKDDKVGITGPMKVPCPYAQSELIIFFCACIKRKIFDELGILDEGFSPGFGEDTDLSVKALRAGYKLIQVPEANDQYYADKKMVGGFPIYHIGSETFKLLDKTNELLTKNRVTLALRYNPSIKLNLGCGKSKINGYLNIDKFEPDVDLVLDAMDLKLFTNDSVDEILCSHLFEYFNPFQAIDILKEWLRILKPGCKIVFEMPNILEICKAFESTEKNKRYDLINSIFSVDTSGQRQQYGWYPEIMEEHLLNAGYNNIKISPAQIPYWGINFRVEAYKHGEIKNEIIIDNKDLPDGWFADHDVQTYREFVSNIPDGGKMLEIGNWKGKSICSVADLIIKKHLQVFTIDTFEGTDSTELERITHKEAKEKDLHQIYKQNLERFGLTSYVTPLVGYSNDFPDIFKDKSLDFIFIDGNHAEEQVRQDIENYYPKIKPHGVISGHDIGWPSVLSAVRSKFGEQFKTNKIEIWYFKKPKIYDAFTFFNELDILDIRLNELKDIIDQTILVECEETHSGNPKPLYFQDNKERYKDFNITHLVSPKIVTHDPWVRERAQRDFILHGLVDAEDDDLIIVTDVDEIPNKRSIPFTFPGDNVLSFDMDFYYYYFNNFSISSNWIEGKIATVKKAKEISPCAMRYSFWGKPHSESNIIPKERGWHFSFVGDVNHIIQKIESFAHQEYNTKEIKEFAESRILEGKDVFGREDSQFEIIENNKALPEYILNNLERFEKNFKKQN